ncbi:MAG: MFS transporter [Candidatus Omnitrophota bacterium]
MKLGISRNVFILSGVSFFNDIASEMIYPLIPLFLTISLKAPLSIVGLIEGIAESTACISRIFSGILSDRWQRRKSFAAAGYFLSTLAKLILSLAFLWPVVLLARFIDRLGKGIRTPPRDALIAESSGDILRGRAFGFHRAMDTLGATIGPLLAIFFLNFLKQNFRLIFFLSFIPAFLGLVLLILFVKEKEPLTLSQKINFNWRNQHTSFKIFLFISLIFALGNSSDAFLILRAKNLGFSPSLVVLLYVVFNFTYALFSTPAGIISDKVGPRKVLISGFLLFALIYLFFGIIERKVFLWFLFPLYGIYMALTEGVGKAYVSHLVPEDKLGTALGVYQMLLGICTFFASFIAGLLWTHLNVQAPFILGSIMAMLSAFLFIILGRKYGLPCFGEEMAS